MQSIKMLNTEKALTVNMFLIFIIVKFKFKFKFLFLIDFHFIILKKGITFFKFNFFYFTIILQI